MGGVSEMYNNGFFTGRGVMEMKGRCGRGGDTAVSTLHKESA